jgi:iron complex transport system permease protein
MSVYGPTVRFGAVSVRVRPRPLVALGLIAAATLAAFCLELAVGEYALPLSDVLGSLLGAGDQATDFIVLELRLPRALTALLAGLALGIAGAIFQVITRNPLASPDVIGVSTGAALGAVALIVFGDASPLAAVPLAALGGAAVAGVALLAFASSGGLQGYRIVLIGIGVAAVGQAGINYVLTRGRIFEAQAAYVWLVGSLNGRGWEHVVPLAAAVGLLVPLALVLARPLRALQLGDDVARVLGVGVERARLALLATAVALTGIAVSAAGPIAFVAFAAPHLARRATGGGSPGALLPVAGVTGALILVAADVVGRVVLAPRELPVGIVTAVLAAPYFLWLLRRANRIGLTG